jgi:adenine-specific DNA-methyltransferase
MRYIGNKTKLLPFLNAAIAKLGIAPGTAHDAFAGTAAVGRALKAAGWHVYSSDLMTYSYVMQRAYVVASETDGFEALAAADADVRSRFAESRSTPRLATIADHLSGGIPPIAGFLAQNFAPAACTSPTRTRVGSTRPARLWRRGAAHN